MAVGCLFFLIFLLCCGAGITLFRRWEYTLAEAGCYGIMSVLMALSLCLQMGILFGSVWIGRVLVAVLVGACLGVLFCRVREWRTIGGLIRFAFGAFPFGMILIGMAWALLTAAAVSHMTAGDITTTADSIRKSCPLPLLNHWVLPRTLFLLFDMPVRIPLGPVAYVAISFGVYAVARRYAWPPTAATVTLIVISTPRLMLETSGNAAELIHAATALFCLLTVHRSIEAPNFRDLIFTIWGLLFGLSHLPMTPAFQAIFAILAGVLLIRRHGTMTWWAMLRRRAGISVAALAGAVLFAQLGLLLENRLGCGFWSPALPESFYNPDGLGGAMLNLARYALEAAHFTYPVDGLMHWVFGFSWYELLVWLHGVCFTDALRQLGAAAPFLLPPAPDAVSAWFGIQGILMILPTLIYSAIRGHRRIKALAVALLGYGYVVCLAVSWRPGNASHFTPVFVCGGVCLALVLPPWRITRRGRRWIQWICAAMMVHTFWRILGAVAGG